jgi:hypothetical protein
MRKLLGIYIMIVFFTGCKINYSFTGASVSPESKTISILDFPNMAPLVNPLLSNVFTEALRDIFLSRTSLQLIERNGDLNIEGTIIGYNTRPMNIKAGNSNGDVAAQNRLTIKVKVKFTNKQDPKANFETTFTRYSDYSSDRNLQDVEDALVDEIVSQLISDIFNKAVVNW